MNSIKMKPVYYYIIAGILCLLTFKLLTLGTQIDVPYYYGGDSLFVSLMIKGVINTGWYISNNDLGAPFGLNMNDFPQSDNLNYLFIKIISLFSQNHAVVLNIFYILTYVLVTLTSIYVLRYFQISYWSCVVGSLLFSFLPYHWMRGEGHLFLSAYYTIPLITLLLFWCLKQEWEKKTITISVIICVVVASTNSYYAFMACVLLAFACVYLLIDHRKIKTITMPLTWLGLIVVVSLLNILPTIFYMMKHGKNPVVGIRPFGETEALALKLTSMVLPVNGHRWEWLAMWKDSYIKGTPLNNENLFASLGFILTIGFVFLLVYLFAKPFNDMKRLSHLTIGCILFGAVGGVGSLFSFAVIAQFRSINRICIFIAFFSVIALFILFDRYARKSKLFYSISLVFILIFGLYDQTTKNFVPGNNAAAYNDDDSFIKQIESQLPKDSMVFQLPHMPFPEHPPINGMTDYEHAKAYLHSATTRWSYGSMKGRTGDAWISTEPNKPTVEMVNDLVIAGYNGIYINRLGYKDQGEKVTGEIQNLIGIEPLESKDKHLAFYNLVEYAKDLKSKTPDWKEKQDDIIQPLIQTWGMGFSEVEGSPGNTWIWSDKVSEIQLINTSNKERELTINFIVATGYPEPSELVISGPLQETLKVNNEGTTFTKKFNLPSGKSTIKFSSNAKNGVVPNDPRPLNFRLNNFEIK